MKWETQTMKVTYHLESDILYIYPKKVNGPETLEQATENLETALLHVGETIKGLVAVMPNHYINAEVTRYYKTHIPNIPIALVADSFFKRMIGNFLLTLASPKRPTKLFSDEKEATAWVSLQIDVMSKVG